MTAALFKRFLYLIATLSIVAIVFLKYYIPQGVWLMVPALLFLNISLDTSLFRRSVTIVTAGALSVLLIFAGTLIAPFVAMQIIVQSLVTGYCVYMGAVRGKAAYPWFAANFLGVLSINADGTFAAAVMHSEAALISIIIVLFAQIILLPFFNRDEYQSCRNLVLRRLRDLSEAIFSCLISVEYPDNIYLFERRIHKEKVRFLDAMGLMSQRAAAAGINHAVTNELQTLFEIIIDIGQVRRRVTDHTTFALCSDELTGINSSIAMLLPILFSGKKNKINEAMLLLEKYVTQFESCFEHVLKVSAREPLAVMLMLSSVKAFIKQCRIVEAAV
jgi:hypothetical protein